MTRELVRASFGGGLDEVDRLLDGGADIDAFDEVWNPLHAAIENEQTECVLVLLTRGADPNMETRDGLSPLAHAVDIAFDGNRQAGGAPGEEPLDIITLLLDAGVSPESGLAVAREYGATHLISVLSSHSSG